MTPAAQEIGRINQRANLEGVHGGEEESMSLPLAPRETGETLNTLCSHLVTYLHGGTQVTCTGLLLGQTIYSS